MELQIYFMTGNHDYYANDFVVSDDSIASVCREHPHLTRLGQGEIVPLDERTVLIGHLGGGGGRSGIGSATEVRMNDSLLISDLKLEGRNNHPLLESFHGWVGSMLIFEYAYPVDSRNASSKLAGWQNRGSQRL